MILLPLLLAAALSAGNAEFDRTAAEGAASITLGRAKSELRAKGPAAGALKAAMLADPGRFVTREAAERECREIYAAAAEKAFADELAAVRERLNLGEDFAVALTDDDRTAIGARYAQAFDTERREACAAQADTLVSATRPTEAEFDAKEDWELREEMAERILREQKTPVFQENRPFINERMVEPVLQSARKEQRRQAEYLMRARSDTYSPSKLGADLRARLEENVKERRAKAEDPTKAWGVFAGTFDKSVGAAVERRTLDRLEKKIEAAELEVEADAIAKTIAADPGAHVKAEESERAFRAQYADGILAGAMESAASEAPSAEKDEFRDYVAARTGDERVVKALDAKVRKDVLPKWREARAAAAARQAAETWPTLTDGTWCPDAELADDLTARSDYAKAVGAWREERGLRSLAEAAGGRPLMEEADRTADAAVAAAFDLARSAIAAQNAIVDRRHQAVLEESRQRKDEFWSKTPDLKAITELLTRATETAWDESRLATLWPDEAKRPANVADQHKALFPSVKRKIELLAKVILEEMNTPQPEEEKKPEEPPPEETPPEETPEEPPPEEPKFTIEISCGEDAIEVTLKSGETTVESATVAPKKDDFENAMYKVTRALSEGILRLK